MKKGWEIKSVGEIADVEYGFTDKSTEEGDYRYVRITDIDSNGKLISADKKYLKHSKEAETFLLQDNDLLMARTGATFGKVLLYEDLEPSVFASYLIRIKFKEKIENKLYWYFSKTKSYWDQANSLASGAAQPHFNGTAVKQVIFSYPKSLLEQQRIVSILDEAFASISKAKANAEQNLTNAKELFESYLQGVFEKKGEGWEEKKLGEVCGIKPPKKEAKEKINDNDFVSFLPMEDLGVCENEIKPKKEKALKDVAGSYTYFAENDVLLAKITPCFENGKLGVARNLTNGIGFGSSEYIVFRCPKNIVPKFLFYFLSRESIREEGKKYMSGAVGHKRVSKDWIENYLFSYPKSLKEQQTIVRQLDALRSETQKLEVIYQKKISSLEELKKSLLQKAFAGELRGGEPVEPKTEKSRRDEKIIEIMTSE